MLRDQFIVARNRLPLADANGRFDYARVAAEYDKLGHRDYPRPDVVPLERAGAILDEIPGFRTPIQPPDVAHYLFNTATIGSGPLTLIELADATLVYDLGNFGLPEFYIFDADKRLVNGLFFGAKPAFVEADRVFSGTTCFVDDFFARPNISHLIFDKYPRYHWAKTLLGDVSPAVFVAYPYAVDLFAAAGASLLQIFDGTRRSGSLRFERLVVASNVAGSLLHPAQSGSPIHVGALQSLREILGVGDLAAAEGSYLLDRQSTGVRTIENWEALRRPLDEIGCRSIDPAGMSFREQVEIFLAARTLVGVHGAGLTNLLFMPEGARIVEILPAWCAAPSYWHTALMMKHDYRPVVSEDPDRIVTAHETWVHDASLNRRNIRLSEEAIEQIVMLARSD